MSEERPKTRPLKLLFGVGMILAGLFAVVSGIVRVNDGERLLIAPDGVINIEVVTTPEARSIGLSGRTELANDSGMLFEFEVASADNCFWMKDTLIDLDMIWIDDDRNIVSVTSAVSPDTYPESFCPDDDAKYGLEINAGRAEELGLQAGASIRF
jgi:uncharacterized membrane protein (UPF0127 family)